MEKENMALRELYSRDVGIITLGTLINEGLLIPGALLKIRDGEFSYFASLSEEGVIVYTDPTTDKDLYFYSPTTWYAFITGTGHNGWKYVTDMNNKPLDAFKRQYIDETKKKKRKIAEIIKVSDRCKMRKDFYTRANIIDMGN
jgi:hypothetical protein